MSVSIHGLDWLILVGNDRRRPAGKTFASQFYLVWSVAGGLQ